MPGQLEQLLGMIANRRRPSGFNADFLGNENIDPSVRADAGLGAMEGEVRDRLFQAERSQGPGLNATSPFEVQALRNLLTGVGRQRTDPSSPLNIQANEVNNQRALNLESINEGFTGAGGPTSMRRVADFGDLTGAPVYEQGSNPTMSPIQQREIYRRNMDRQKLEQPAQIEGMRQAGENFRQSRAIPAALENTRVQMSPSQSYADVNREQWEAMQRGGIDPNRIRSIGRSGLQFQTNRPDPSTIQMDRDLSTARYNMGSRDPFADPTSARPEMQNFWSNVRGRIANSKLDTQSQVELYQWLQDPTDQGVPQSFDEAFPPPQPPNPRDQGAVIMYRQDLDNWNEARKLALLFRGSL